MVAKRQKENYNIKVRKLFLQTKQKNKAKVIQKEVDESIVV